MAFKFTEEQLNTLDKGRNHDHHHDCCCITASDPILCEEIDWNSHGSSNANADQLTFCQIEYDLVLDFAKVLWDCNISHALFNSLNGILSFGKHTIKSYISEIGLSGA